MNLTRHLPIALFSLSLLFTKASAQVVYEYKVTLQPIQVGFSGEFANMSGIYYAEAQKVWDQAKILLEWLPANQFTGTYAPPYDTLPGQPANYLYIGGEGQKGFDNLAVGAPAGGSSNPNVINIWFVKNLVDGGTDLAGQTLGSSMVIDEQGVALRHVIPHEIGHSLLGDSSHSYGISQGVSNLMHSSPTVPSSINDIGPPPTGLLQLTPSQITAARLSGFAVAIPEAENYAVLAAVAAFGAVLRRRTRIRRMKN